MSNDRRPDDLRSQVPTGLAPAPAGQPAGSSTVAPVAPVKRDGPDPGLPIPDRYGRDRLVLMVQDPFHVFAYWEITPETLSRARDAAGGGATVLLLETPSGLESREVDLAGGNYYLSVAPSTTYGAQLAIRDASGRLHVLAVSNKVQTPSPTVSARQDEAWMAVDETFGELLEIAGLPGAGGSSLARLSSAALQQRMVAWNITHVDSRSMFSGVLARGGQQPGETGPLNLSSFSLSSTALYSGSLSSGALQRQS